MKSRLGWGSVPAAPPASYAAGETIDLEASLYRAQPRTVFFFVRSSCPACQRSRPIMAGIAADLAGHAGARVIMVTPAAADEELAFARGIGLAPSQVVHPGPGTLRLKRIPAFVVVDNQGAILFAREGLLTESDRRELVQIALETGSPLRP